MATIKSYTNLEQSKKLAEILPLESADMFHFIHEVDTVGFGYKKDAEEFYSKTDFEYIPCWSLAALLDVIPNPDLIQNSEGTWLVRSWVNAYPWSVGGYSNPVDACYEMILKLKEKNLL